jgi:hypothetical protein
VSCLKALDSLDRCTASLSHAQHHLSAAIAPPVWYLASSDSELQVETYAVISTIHLGPFRGLSSTSWNRGGCQDRC